MYSERPCRSCGGQLESVLDLGSLHLNAFPAAGDPAPEAAPLDLCQCEGCNLVQLRHTVAPDQLFRHYWYRSSVNETMRAELASVAAQAQAWVPLLPGDTVVDIGANDGTLLAAFPHSLNKVAYEPAQNLLPELSRVASRVVASYFPSGEMEGRLHRDVALVCSIACFYDVDDPHAFVAAIEQVLAPGGAWIVQFQDLAQMISATAFDNNCHEHLIYYSLASFEHLIAPHGLQVVHAERRAINGGSLRLIVQRTGRPDQPSVVALRAQEVGCADWETLARFAWRVGEQRTQIKAAVLAARDRGVVDLYGASTKGNTLLQVCGLDSSIIRQAWERSPEKVGRTTVTGIPIVDEITGRFAPPDLLVAIIWQFRDAILRREASYLEHGGTILFPLPAVDLVSGGGR